MLRARPARLQDAFRGRQQLDGLVPGTDALHVHGRHLVTGHGKDDQHFFIGGTQIDRKANSLQRNNLFIRTKHPHLPPLSMCHLITSMKYPKK